jgi:TrmH family RNA methyltransferase
MGDPSTIRSAANPAVKRVRAVAAGRERGVLLLEGDRLVAEARRAGLPIELLLFADDRADEARAAAAAGLPAHVVEGTLLDRLSALDTSPGCLALASAPDAIDPTALPSGSGALLVVAAGVQDPGNLGAIARTAEAAGAAGLVATLGGCSPWNPKALRGSMGSLLRLPVAHGAPCEADAVAAALSALGFRQVRAATRGGTPLCEFDWSGRVALWLTAETGALPEAASEFEGVTVEMAGSVESLNVGAAAAVLLFAAGRAGEAR